MRRGERPVAGVYRPTSIGPFGGSATGGTNRTRVVPVPWIDCEDCAWRHYPSIIKGRWHIATTCVNCGAALAVPADPRFSPDRVA